MDNSYIPLAERIRPKTLQEFVGQKHLVGPSGILKMLIEKDQLISLILWGPPGSGKTTLAKIIANTTQSHFKYFSAVSATLDELKNAIEEAKKFLIPKENTQLTLNQYEKKNIDKTKDYKRTIIFIDEIHRFNKTQQDALLPYIENGTIIFIGATTENPSFEIIGPLLSRCRVLKLNRLKEEELSIICKRGLKEIKKDISNDALNFLIESSNGDARILLNILEIADKIYPNKKTFTLKDIEIAIQEKPLLYDKKSEEHYNTISAFIKSMRGSDPDGALYYLARMLEAGEDPLFIARRMIIFASEDIGNADPYALPLAVSVFEACERVGLPECKINLAQGVTYLSSAPKSNASYTALIRAEEDVKKTLNEPIPLYLRNPTTKLMKKLGYGKNYRYPHLEPNHFARGVNYLPEKLKGRKYYQPTNQGEEEKIKLRLENQFKK